MLRLHYKRPYFLPPMAAVAKTNGVIVGKGRLKEAFKVARITLCKQFYIIMPFCNMIDSPGAQYQLKAHVQATSEPKHKSQLEFWLYLQNNKSSSSKQNSVLLHLGTIFVDDSLIMR